MTIHLEALKAAQFALNKIPNTRLDHPDFANSYAVAKLVDSAVSGATPAATEKARAKAEADAFTLKAEAATCLWEAMLEVRFRPGHFKMGPQFEKTWDDFGTSAMRHCAIGLATLCADTYSALPEDIREKFTAYDWDFCPSFLKNLPRADWNDWAIYGPRNLPSVAECADAMTKADAS